MWNSRRIIWLCLQGPGRVAVQSAYEHVDHGSGPVQSVSAMPRLTAFQSQTPKVMAQPVAPPAHRTSTAHEQLEQLVRAAMVNGLVPAEAIPGLQEAAKQRGMSVWDLNQIIHAAQYHRR